MTLRTQHRHLDGPSASALATAIAVMDRVAMDRVPHTTLQIGPKRRLTPEGFLYCHDVPIARTGSQVYGLHELPQGFQPGPDGLVMVERGPDELFSESTLASYQGKPVVFPHPPAGPDDLWGVTPDNFQMYTVGTVLNPRRGTGENADLMIADLLIKDRNAIDAVLNGLVREVSCGYLPEYEQIAPGRGRQTNIIGNHVALVPSGRCGPRCAIGDEELDMTNPTTHGSNGGADQSGWEQIKAGLSAIMKSTKDETAAGAEKAGNVNINIGSAPPGTAKAPEQTGDNEDPMEKRVKGLEDGMAGIQKSLDALAKKFGADADDPDKNGNGNGEKKGSDQDPDEKDKDGKGAGDNGEKDDPDKSKSTGDSAALQPAHQDVIAKGEIVAGGSVVAPAFDAKIPSAQTQDALCQYRRRALDYALGDANKAAVLKPLVGNDGRAKLPAMTCDAVEQLFNGAAALIGAANNAKGSAATAVIQKQFLSTGDGKTASVGSVADLNAKNREHWGIQ